MAKVQFVEKPPDGGWGWVIVASTFLLHVVVVGTVKSFGVFYTEFREVFQESAGVTSFINSILGAAVLLFSLFAGALCNLTSCRTVVIAGGVISAVGLVVSFFAQTMIHLLFSVGFGLSLMFSPGLAMIGRYFDKRHATANGIAVCGTGVGIFALPPLFQFLIDEFGWRGALLIVSGLLINGCVFGAMLRPINLKDDQKEEDVGREERRSTDQKLIKGIHPTCQKIMETFDVTLLKHRPFLVYCVSLFGTLLGNSMIFVHLVAHAQNLGVEKTPAAFLLSILGISEAASRLLNGWLADRGKISKVYYYMIGLTGLAICNIIIPFGRSYTVLVVCVVFYGFFSGIFYALIAVLVRKYVGASRISCGLGWAFVFEGAAFLLGAPVAGWLYDATGKYDMSFYAAGIFIFLSVIVLIPITCSKSRCTRGPSQNGDEVVGLDDMKKLSMFRHVIDDDDEDDDRHMF
ncbi:monocarboxylate transporter 13-like [Branchiostoma lanceolatum]|uniref:monocarboxylate transporter 13-like n=1 Tax=Branchiostoma lanceolatum TaxID=7740 RepID=UPI0034532482